MNTLRREPGIVAVVDIGCSCWSLTRRRQVNGDEIAVGGIVVAVTEQPDHDTGEILRAFRVVDPDSRPRLHWSILPERDVDSGTIEALDATALRRACKRLAEEAAFEGTRRWRHGHPSPYEARCVIAMATLMELVAGDTARADCAKALDPQQIATLWRGLCGDVAMSRGVFTLALARRAFAAQELTALVYGAGAALWAELEPDAPGAPAEARPTMPANVAAFTE